jgi:hypothetical protein
MINGTGRRAILEEIMANETTIVSAISCLTICPLPLPLPWESTNT